MYTVLVVVQLLVAVALIGLILIQHGKGADAGAAFGSGASGTVFGARGSATFLSRATGWLATLFFLSSLALAYLVHGDRTASSVVDRVEASQPATPAEQAPAPAVPPAGESGKPVDDGQAPAIPE